MNPSWRPTWLPLWEDRNLLNQIAVIQCATDKQWARTKTRHQIVINTDASWAGSTAGLGAQVTLCNQGREVDAIDWWNTVGNCTSAFTAELYAAKQVLDMVGASFSPTSVVLATDCKALLSLRVKGCCVRSAARMQYLQAVQAVTRGGFDLTIAWIPRRLNRHAHRMAAKARRRNKAIDMLEEYKHHHDSTMTTADMSSGLTGVHLVPEKAQRVYCRLISGLARLNAYTHRWHEERTRLCRFGCMARETIDHILWECDSEELSHHLTRRTPEECIQDPKLIPQLMEELERVQIRL